MSNQAINGLNIPSIQNNKQVSFKQNATPSMQGVTIPEQGYDTFQNTASMQGVDPNAVKQAADNNYIANRAKASADSNPLAVAGLTGVTWYGLAQGMDKINLKYSGDWETSLPGKVSKWADDVSSKGIARKIDRGLRRIEVQLHKWAKKSKFLYSLMNHSTRPENQFAKGPGMGMDGFFGMDVNQIVNEFMEPMAGKPKTILGFHTGELKNMFQKLENYGVSQADIDNLFDSVKGKTPLEQAFALQQKELEMLGAHPNIKNAKITPENLTKLQKYSERLKLKAMGLTRAQFEALKDKALDNPKEFQKIFERLAENPQTKDWQVSIWRGKGNSFFHKIANKLGDNAFGRFFEKIGNYWVKAKNHLFGRTVKMSEYRNKYYALNGSKTKSKLGKVLNKSLAWILEGGTNRFAGGKFAVLMQAAIFGDMFYQTIKAPKNEKLKTLMERGVNDFSYFIALTLGIMGMHKIGGFKYAGMSVAQREAYRAALKVHNDKVVAKAFTKAEHKASEKALKNMLNAKGIKNPITKLFHKIGKFINIGNERVLAYRSNSKWNMNFFRRLANGNIIGVPMRIIIPMMIITPFIAKAATTLCHKIFGRPTHSVLDEEQEEQQPDQAQQPTAQNPQQPAVAPTQNPTMGNNPQPKDPQTYADSNLIKQTLNGTKKPVRTYIPSPDCQIKGMAPTRNYIPSPQGMVQENPDLTAAERAMAQADMAEKHINETLASLNQPL
jgi:hypothetical protein